MVTVSFFTIDCWFATGELVRDYVGSDQWFCHLSSERVQTRPTWSFHLDTEAGSFRKLDKSVCVNQLVHW